MISLKRTIIIATVAGTVLLGGGAVASACPGDELPAGQVSAGAVADGGSTPPAQQQDTEAPLSPACTAALVTASNDHGARFSSVAASVASACAEDSATLGTVINYVTAH